MFHTCKYPRRQPSLPPGVYFRMLFVGYFENIDSQRGIAWRCADSLSLRSFLGIPLDEGTPDHSTMTNTRKRLPAEVFDEVFQFVLGIAEAKALIAGKTVGVDSTTLEANAAMKSIVRKDTGEDWTAYVVRLMREAGVVGLDETPSKEEVKHPRFVVHFTPTSGSWLNQVERFFAAITDKQIRRSSFKSVKALEKAIQEYLDHHNADAKPFQWTADAELILKKVEDVCKRINQSGH